MGKFKVHKQKIKHDDDEEKQKSISTVMDRHNQFYENINEHIKKEINTQEDEFSRAMRQRRERSVNRSVNRSSNMNDRGKKDAEEDMSNVLKHLKLDAKNKIDNPFEN